MEKLELTHNVTGHVKWYGHLRKQSGYSSKHYTQSYHKIQQLYSKAHAHKEKTPMSTKKPTRKYS